MNGSDIKYLVPAEGDQLWGLTVTSVGNQVITSEEEYPPQNHPKGYFFDVEAGRVLDEFQLLYITDGEGIITYGEKKITQRLTEGKMFLIFPGMWHTYQPDEHSGWKEYWIGFKGEMIDRLVAAGYFTPDKPVFEMGFNEPIVDLYLKACDIAHADRIGAQPALSGIVMHMLGLMYFRQQSHLLDDENMISKINKAKVVMRETIYENLTPHDIADRIGLGYSVFRKAFREYAGIAPAQYMKEFRVNEAKLLLANTTHTIKEISYILKYDNPEYFSIAFKKRTGKTPLMYRNFARQKVERK